jgi:hypothetical protein
MLTTVSVFGLGTVDFDQFSITYCCNPKTHTVGIEGAAAPAPADPARSHWI